MFKRIQIKCRAINSAYGLFDHYFLAVTNEFELHFGNYKHGKIRAFNYTKNAHVVAERVVCERCYKMLFLDLLFHEDDRILQLYYPFINCETLSMGFSIQSCVLCVGLIIISVSLIKGLWLVAIIALLLSVVILLLYSKYTYSATKHSQCPHVNLDH